VATRATAGTYGRTGPNVSVSADSVVPDSGDGSSGGEKRHLALAVVGPVLLTILFLVVMEMRGDGDFAPGQGAGYARRTMVAFALYGVALLALVVWGTSKCRHAATKVIFAVVSLCVSVVLMFFAFFSQMAA
jgi:hypothetical protein